MNTTKSENNAYVMQLANQKTFRDELYAYWQTASSEGITTVVMK